MDSITLDIRVIDKLHKLGGDEFVKKMFRLFMTNTAQKILDAKEGTERDDIVKAERAAHSIISSAGNVGAQRLMDLAVQCEAAAAGKQTEAVAALVGQMQTEFDEVKTRLEELSQGMIE